MVAPDVLCLQFESDVGTFWKTYVAFEKSGVHVFAITVPANGVMVRSIWIKNDVTSRLVIPLATLFPRIEKLKHTVEHPANIGTEVRCKPQIKTLTELIRHVNTFTKEFTKHRNNKLKVNAISSPSADNFPTFYLSFH
jgi:hypothetical protein